MARARTSWVIALPPMVMVIPEVGRGAQRAQQLARLHGVEGRGAVAQAGRQHLAWEGPRQGGHGDREGAVSVVPGLVPQKPIHASAAVVAEEERAIKGVCGSTCPINAVLDRVIITATGTQACALSRGAGMGLC